MLHDGVHRWTDKGVQYTCGHADLSEEEQRRKKWLSKSTEVYKVFSALVLDKFLAKDLDQMAEFKHTGKFSDEVILV